MHFINEDFFTTVHLAVGGVCGCVCVCCALNVETTVVRGFNYKVLLIGNQIGYLGYSEQWQPFNRAKKAIYISCDQMY